MKITFSSNKNRSFYNIKNNLTKYICTQMAICRYGLQCEVFDLNEEEGAEGRGEGEGGLKRLSLKQWTGWLT